MADGQIIVELILDDGQILKALGRVKQEADKVKDDLEKDSGGGFLSKKIGDISIGLAAVGAAAYKGFKLLEEGFSHSVSAARDSQKAIDDLSTALAINGKFTDQAVGSFQRFASQLQEQTGINDDIITQNASLLVSLGHLSDEGLQNATKAAVDLAAATGKDMSAAFGLVAKAAEGNVEVLKRYGIVVDEHLPKSEKFAQALAQLNTKFGGLAAARADTFEGSLNKLSNAFDELFKAFGNVIIKSPVVRELIKLAADGISKFADTVSNAVKGKDLFGDFIKRMIPVAENINTYLVKPMEIFFRLVVTGVAAISTIFFGLVSIFAFVGQKFFEYIGKPIAEFFTVSLASIVGFFDEELGDKLLNSFQGIGDHLKGAAALSSAAVGQMYESSLGAVMDSANTAFETSGSAAIQVLLDNAQKAADVATETSNNLKVISAQNQAEIVETGITVGGAFDQVLIGMSGAAKEFAQNAQANFRKVGATMFQTLGTGAANAFAAFGKAVVSGDDKLKAFLNAMLATFGQAMIQMGTMFILQGIALTWAYQPNGPPLIAAGAALAAFGGILTALGGGGGGGGASANGGGMPGDGTVSSIDNPNAQFQNPDAPRAQDRMTINIHGDVLDSDDTGSRIVKLLADYNDKNGNGATIT